MERKLEHYLHYYTTFLNLIAYPVFALASWIFLTQERGVVYILAYIALLILLAILAFLIYKLIYHFNKI